jgi:hypothetical protein
MKYNEPSEFFAEIYRLVAVDKSREALTEIYDFLDDLLLEHRFTAVDAILKAVDLSKLDPTCMLGFLSITYVYRDRLTQRKPFRHQIKLECLVRRYSEEKVDQLFGDMK